MAHKIVILCETQDAQAIVDLMIEFGYGKLGDKSNLDPYWGRNATTIWCEGTGNLLFGEGDPVKHSKELAGGYSKIDARSRKSKINNPLPVKYTDADLDGIGVWGR